MFQSLLHQVNPSNGGPRPTTVTVRVCFNPFFIRSILPTLAWAMNKVVIVEVSIPSSSGQSFQLTIDLKWRLRIPAGFNPFFIRSILPTLGHHRPSVRCGDVSIPSSSGQSFQPLAGTAAGIWLERISFNPFFIRSILPTVHGANYKPGDLIGFNPFFIRSILPTR